MKRFRSLKPRRQVLYGVAAVVVAYLFVGGSDGFYVQWRLSRQIDRLTAENTAMRARNAALRDQIRRLQTDTTYIERIAREKYGMARPGERVYRVLPASGGGAGGGNG